MHEPYVKNIYLKKNQQQHFFLNQQKIGGGLRTWILVPIYPGTCLCQALMKVKKKKMCELSKLFLKIWSRPTWTSSPPCRRNPETITMTYDLWPLSKSHRKSTTQTVKNLMCLDISLGYILLCFDEKSLHYKLPPLQHVLADHFFHKNTLSFQSKWKHKLPIIHVAVKYIFKPAGPVHTVYLLTCRCFLPQVAPNSITINNP